MTLPLPSSRRSRQFNPTDVLPYIKIPKGETQVELVSLDIEVSVTGIYAEATQVMRFYNPNDRPLSGELFFPLPDDAVVCGYALDINGRMRDAVVVPKQEARRILEAEERKGADPGLVEQVLGNVYKTRVYPLPARGTRTVSITYMTGLVVDGNSASCHLPLRHAQELEEVSLRVEVLQAPQTPEISGAQGNLTMTRWTNSWVAEAKLTKGAATEDLVVRLPDLPDELVMVEKTADGDCYFAVSMATQNDETSAKPWLAESVAIAWDASASRVNIDKDLAFLGALLDGWKDVAVHVVVFRNTLDEKPYRFDIRNGDSSELTEFLRKLTYDGATDLNVLDFSSCPSDSCEAWLLFSDCLDTVSGTWVPQVGNKKVVVVSSETRSNGPVREYLAEKSGGVSVNLIHQSPSDAAGKVISNDPKPYISGSTNCTDLFIKSAGSRLLVSGKMDAEEGKVLINRSSDNQVTIDVKTEAENLTPNPRCRVISRMWASHKISQLLLTESPQSEAVIEDGSTVRGCYPGNFSAGARRSRSICRIQH